MYKTQLHSPKSKALKLPDLMQNITYLNKLGEKELNFLKVVVSIVSLCKSLGN